jgi:hypothetical protein
MQLKPGVNFMDFEDMLLMERAYSGSKTLKILILVRARLDPFLPFYTWRGLGQKFQKLNLHFCQCHWYKMKTRFCQMSLILSAK